MSDAGPKPFVFVLMPFKKEFDDIYTFGIKAACGEAGTYCERVDEQVFDGSIVDRIFNQIAKADIVVADMTGQNANVFFETGYAMALGKRIIFLTQKSEDIPFDLKHYTHIIYGGSIGSLKSDLVKRVQYFKDHPGSKSIATFDSFELYVAGEMVRENCILRLELPIVSRTLAGRMVTDNVDLSLVVRNISSRPIDISGFQFAFLFPEELAKPVMPNSAIVRLSGARLMYVNRPLHLDLFPGGWHTEQITLVNYNPESAHGKMFTCELQILSELGQRSIPFMIHVPFDEGTAKPSQ